jgi:hypothetical protein
MDGRIEVSAQDTVFDLRVIIKCVCPWIIFLLNKQRNFGETRDGHPCRLSQILKNISRLIKASFRNMLLIAEFDTFYLKQLPFHIESALVSAEGSV